jgi:uncharacterized protein (DUF924 family)
MDKWETNLKECLAVILLFGQFTKNIFRDTPKAFLGDAKALELNFFCLHKGYLHRNG